MERRGKRWYSSSADLGMKPLRVLENQDRQCDIQDKGQKYKDFYEIIDSPFLHILVWRENEIHFDWMKSEPCVRDDDIDIPAGFFLAPKRTANFGNAGRFQPEGCFGHLP
jgi:hypothetical protein